MTPPLDEKALLKQFKDKVESELRKLELETVGFWLEELHKIEARRHQGLDALTNDLRVLMGRMQNRLKVLKTSK